MIEKLCVHYSLRGRERYRKMGGSKSVPEKVTFELRLFRMSKSHTHLNAEFQRIARIDKKAFLSEQHKETEENSRKGKTRDRFMKLSDTK